MKSKAKKKSAALKPRSAARRPRLRSRSPTKPAALATRGTVGSRKPGASGSHPHSPGIGLWDDNEDRVQSRRSRDLNKDDSYALGKASTNGRNGRRRSSGLQ